MVVSASFLLKKVRSKGKLRRSSGVGLRKLKIEGFPTRQSSGEPAHPPAVEQYLKEEV